MASSMLQALLSLLSNPMFLLVYLMFSLLCFKLNRKTYAMTNYPVIGMLPALLANLNNIHAYITDVLRERGCTFYFRGPWFLGMDFLLTCDPANVNHVFNANFTNYPKGREFSEIFEILGEGIFNADDELWRSQRKKAHSLVAQLQFRSFVAAYSHEKMESGLVPLLGQLADGGTVVDLQEVFLRLTFDMTCNLVFGVDPGCLSPEFPTIPFACAMDDAMEALFIRHVVPSPVWKMMRWLRIGKEKKLAAAHKVMDAFVAQSIKKSREAKNYEGSLITSYINNGEHLDCIGHDDKFIRDTTVNYMLAGRDTTAAALAWFFWLLSKSPSVKSKLMEELSLHDGTGEDLTKSVYLHAALCESLRLYPPVPFEHKTAVRADVLPTGANAPAGKKILFFTYSMWRMEGVWGKDCLEFRPERWISERGTLRHEPSYKFLAFNCGPRTCVGKDIAFTQMKAVVAAVVLNFDIEPIEGYLVEPKPSIMLHMKNGWKVRIKRKRQQ